MTSSSYNRIQQISRHVEQFEHGGDLVAEVLHKHGVKFLFTLIGGHISPIIVSSKNKGIRVIDVRHEVNAVFAADAVSRLSPTPGVACVTAGPGLTNTITAVKNAFLAQSPLILLGGATATLLKGRGSLQDINQQSLFAPHVKWQATIKSIREIIPTLEKAFAISQSGVPGPVFIEFPIDILYPEKMIRAEFESKLQGGSITQDLVKWYTNRHLSNIYQKDNIMQPSPQTPTSSLASDSQIQSALSMIKKAKKPVMILGSQTVLQSDKVLEVQKAVEQIGVPVYLSGMARGLMGKSHNLQMKHKRGIALKQSDLVILIGVPFDFRLGYGMGFSPKIQTISVNLDKIDLTKNRSPTLKVLAQPSNFIIRLGKAFKGSPQNYSQWIQTLRNNDNERDLEIVQLSKEPTNKYLNPLRVCLEVEKSLADNSIIVADGGDFVATASYILKPPTPLSWLDPGVFGTLGVGAGFALGAKLCRPESEVWLIWGDGSAGYSIMEYDTFVRHNIPIISVIGNDGCWSQIYRDQTEVFKSDAGCMLAHNDYHKISEALGATGFVVDSEAQLTDTFQQAKQQAKEGKPVVINAFIGQTDFRKGSISV